MADIRSTLYVRDEQGRTFGPLALAAIRVMVSGRTLKGRLLFSRDGTRFDAPARFPELKDVLPASMLTPEPPPRPASSAPAVTPAAPVPSSAPTAPVLTPPA